MKKILIAFLVLFVIAFFARGSVNDFFMNYGDSEEILSEKTRIPQDFGGIEIYFCPEDGCEEVLLNEIKSAEKIDCAFFDLNLENVIEEIRDKEHRLIVDDANFDKFKMNFARKDGKQGLMHNKFCILDDSRVLTGSMNPTKNGVGRNNNNLVVIESKTLVENYNDEFEEMWGGDFGRGENVEKSSLMFNGFLVENYFCPEDNCEGHVLDILKNAKKRIYFMTFSFTSDGIGEEIIKNFHFGIDIKGVFEKTQAGSKYSEYSKFNELGMDVKLDTNKGAMHHKVFIVDDVVIFGSYNPSKSGNEKNDENVLIIHDFEIAEKFVEEFWRIF